MRSKNTLFFHLVLLIIFCTSCNKSSESNIETSTSTEGLQDYEERHLSDSQVDLIMKIIRKEKSDMDIDYYEEDMETETTINELNGSEEDPYIWTDLLDESNGYRLICSDPAGGYMRKRLERTTDGGESWELVNDITDIISNYPKAMSFLSDDIGFVLTDYHSERNYIYITHDGGVQWDGLYLGEDRDVYSNGISINIDRDTGEILVYTEAEVDDNHYENRKYRSNDSGETWSRVMDN